MCRFDQGRIDEAMDQAWIAVEKNSRWRPWLGHVLVKAGRFEEASALLEELVSASIDQIGPAGLAQFQAVYGDLDGAMESLEWGFEAHHGSMPWIGSFQDFEALKDDPRFLDLLDRMELEFVWNPAAPAGTTS